MNNFGKSCRVQICSTGQKLNFIRCFMQTKALQFILQMHPLAISIALVLQFFGKTKRERGFKANSADIMRCQLGSKALDFEFVLTNLVGSHLCVGLCCITRIGQKNKLVRKDNQGSITSGKTAQVANILRLAENQGIKLKPYK